MFGASILALLLQVAAPSDTCSYGNPGTTVIIAPGESSFAVIEIDNKLARRLYTFCDLTLFGIVVRVEYAPGSGALPDWFHVTPPPGFIAVPPSILIDDNDTGEVLIILKKGLGA
jgi:hypothetical protein